MVGHDRALAHGVVGEGDKVAASGLSLFHGCKSVYGLAGLGDGDDEGRRADDRVPVAKLGGVFRLGGNAGQRLDHAATDCGCMKTGAHSEDNHAFGLRQHFSGVGEFGEEDVGGVDADMSPHQVGHRFGLFHDLLEHEMLVAILGEGDIRVGDGDGFAGQGDAIPVKIGCTVGLQKGQLAIPEVDGTAGKVRHGRKVAGKEHLIAAIPDDYPTRITHPGGDNLAGFVRSGHRDGKGSFQESKALPDGIDKLQTRSFLVFHEMGYNFRIGLRGELVPCSQKPGLEIPVVLYNSVVDYHVSAGAVGVGMSVLGCGLAMGSPAGVANTGGPIRHTAFYAG